TEVVVRAGEVAYVNLVLSSAGLVTGRTLLNGKPAAGVVIRLGEPGTTRWSLEAVSAADGRIRIESVPLGRLSVASTNHRVVTPQTLVVSGGEVDHVDFSVTRLAAISGRVVRIAAA